MVGWTTRHLCRTLPVADDGSNPDGTDFPKVYEWRRCDGTSTIERSKMTTTWTTRPGRPVRCSQGHRGFLDGELVMMMYAWSPTGTPTASVTTATTCMPGDPSTAVATWTTTPADLGGAGVTYTEYYYGESIGDPVPVEWTYAAGCLRAGAQCLSADRRQDHHPRPRYSPTGGMKLYPDQHLVYR